MLIVGFWRDFHPDRHLSTTRPQFVQIINGLAGKDICKTRGWDKLKPERWQRVRNGVPLRDGWNGSWNKRKSARLTC
jgi:hypothetical protein